MTENKPIAGDVDKAAKWWSMRSSLLNFVVPETDKTAKEMLNTLITAAKEAEGLKERVLQVIRTNNDLVEECTRLTERVKELEDVVVLSSRETHQLMGAKTEEITRLTADLAALKNNVEQWREKYNFIHQENARLRYAENALKQQPDFTPCPKCSEDYNNDTHKIMREIQEFNQKYDWGLTVGSAPVATVKELLDLLVNAYDEILRVATLPDEKQQPDAGALVSFLETRALRSSYCWSGDAGGYSKMDILNEGSITCAVEALAAWK